MANIGFDCGEGQRSTRIGAVGIHQGLDPTGVTQCGSCAMAFDPADGFGRDAGVGQLRDDGAVPSPRVR